MDLERFLKAQAPVYADVLMELRHGDKTSHWMWFIFPQGIDTPRSNSGRRSRRPVHIKVGQAEASSLKKISSGSRLVLRIRSSVRF